MFRQLHEEQELENGQPVAPNSASHARGLRKESPDIASLPIPDRFQVKHELGRGGMGSVYLAYDREAGHEVALKILHGVGPEDRLRLKNEFRSLRGIVHPNLVDLHELVITEGVCFFTMEYVRGVDLRTRGFEIRSEVGDLEQRFDRFRSLALQLALALHALHEDGKLHRDVKPSNVLVTASDRVVLLDFGLTRSTTAPDPSEQEGLAGTVLYMSPEQLWGKPLTPASDWYSFAVTLREALTGVAPERSDLLIGRRKTANESGFELPEDLDSLIGDLLQTDPRQRPEASDILSRLGGNVESYSIRPSLLPRAKADNLVGRAAELDCLREALSQTALEPRVVRLSGPSGIGKSTLMRFFLDGARDEGALILRSKCHPKETLVFNALDGFVDEFARELRANPIVFEELQAKQLEALSQVFPVLAHAVRGDLADPPVPINGTDKRRLAAEAIRTMLRGAARSRKLVIWLDDVQWGDADSGRLLRNLLTSSNHLPLLLVLSYRDDGEDQSACLAELKKNDELWEASASLALHPLDNQQSIELLNRVVGTGWPVDDGRRDEFLRWAAGSPFFLTELARHLESVRSMPDVTSFSALQGLGELLKSRTQRLPPAAQTVLEVLAVAGSPLERGTILAAAKMDSVERGIISDLEEVSVVRTLEVDRHQIEFYHDKLREEVARTIPEERKIAHHIALAHAVLDTTNPNPLAAIEHFEAAGDLDSVRRYVVKAAGHALKLLAFERAARLYQRAIELRPAEVAQHELYRRLGSALGSAGRGKESALAFSTAAHLLSLEPENFTEEVLRLRQSAAEQFIQTGHFEQGVETIRGVLVALQVPFPETRSEALQKALALRLWSMARRTRLDAGRETPSQLALCRFDALFTAGTRLAMVDYALCTYAVIRCVHDAARLGDPSRLSRALMTEATYCSTLPLKVFQQRAAKLLRQALALLQDARCTPYDLTYSKSVRSIIAFYTGHYRQAWQLADEAIAELPPGRTWERNPWTMWSLLGLALNGELALLIRRVRKLREEATVLDDRHLEQNISLGAPAMAWLALDQPEDALRNADRALTWAPSNYTVQHYQHYVTAVDCDLYLGSGLSAWRRTRETWPSHKKEYFLTLTYVRDDLLRTRARAAIAAFIELSELGRAATDAEETRDQLLEAAREAARQMKRHGTNWAVGFAALVDAGLANLDKNVPLAVKELNEASMAFEKADMQLFRHVARYLMDRLRRAKASESETWLANQGVRKPERMAAVIAPGFTEW